MRDVNDAIKALEIEVAHLPASKEIKEQALHPRQLRINLEAVPRKHKRRLQNKGQKRSISQVGYEASILRCRGMDLLQRHTHLVPQLRNLGALETRNRRKALDTKLHHIKHVEVVQATHHKVVGALL